ncbi:hypothetical protein Pelo_8998 [Pelomyxa schiedti]|nr:hypothetical protein Pelo_8998 [Pelomyxa schiedti]
MYWRDQVTSLIMGTHQRCGSKSPVSLVALPVLLSVLIREWLDVPDQVTTLQLFGDVERNRERSQTSLWVIAKFSKATLGVLGTPLCVMGAELPKEWVVGAKYLFTDSNHKLTVGLGRWIVQARFPKDLKIIRIRNGIPEGKLLWVDRGSFSESAWNLSAPLYVIPDTEGDGIFRGGELLLVCPTSGDVKLIHGPSGCLLMQIQPTNYFRELDFLRCQVRVLTQQVSLPVSAFALVLAESLLVYSTESHRTSS